MHSLVLAFAALCELLDLAKLDGVEGITDDNGVVGDVSGQVGGHLIANVKQVLILLEPHSLGMEHFGASLFMACTSMLWLAFRTFNSLTQVVLPILASVLCFCSANFSTRRLQQPSLSAWS